MKKLLSILLFAFSFQLSSFAQQTNLDSLHQVWLDETQPDTTRFKAFKDFIWHGYLFTSPDTAFALAEK
jgi:hypothetical protein